MFSMGRPNQTALSLHDNAERLFNLFNDDAAVKKSSVKLRNQKCRRSGKGTFIQFAKHAKHLNSLQCRCWYDSRVQHDRAFPYLAGFELVEVVELADAQVQDQIKSIVLYGLIHQSTSREKQLLQRWRGAEPSIPKCNLIPYILCPEPPINSPNSNPTIHLNLPNLTNLPNTHILPALRRSRQPNLTLLLRSLASTHSNANTNLLALPRSCERIG